MYSPLDNMIILSLKTIANHSFLTLNISFAENLTYAAKNKVFSVVYVTTPYLLRPQLLDSIYYDGSAKCPVLKDDNLVERRRSIDVCLPNGKYHLVFLVYSESYNLNLTISVSDIAITEKSCSFNDSQMPSMYLCHFSEYDYKDAISNYVLSEFLR